MCHELYFVDEVLNPLEQRWFKRQACSYCCILQNKFIFFCSFLLFVYLLFVVCCLPGKAESKSLVPMPPLPPKGTLIIYTPHIKCSKQIIAEGKNCPAGIWGRGEGGEREGRGRGEGGERDGRGRREEIEGRKNVKEKYLDTRYLIHFSNIKCSEGCPINHHHSRLVSLHKCIKILIYIFIPMQRSI